MATLAEKGLIVNEKYKEIYLTEKGRELAALTAQKHRTIRGFFIQVLHIDAKIADEDACAIEHARSARNRR